MRERKSRNEIWAAQVLRGTLVNMRFHITILSTLLLLAGCTRSTLTNPSFDLTMDEAKIEWEEMEHDPKPLQRPLIVLGGIYDPGLAAKYVADQMRDIAAQDARIVHLSFFEKGSFDSCADKLINKLDELFPCDDDQFTTEVDVIGFSMGGLVARYAASDQYAQTHNGRKLRIARLFTISSPHQGAKLAVVPTIDRRVIDMRSKSEFMNSLNAEEPEYELIPYARLGDNVVGEHNSAPAGRTPWWLPKHGGLSHAMAGRDVRILADIARRLRGETPYTTSPPSPLPEDG